MPDAGCWILDAGCWMPGPTEDGDEDEDDFSGLGRMREAQLVARGQGKDLAGLGAAWRQRSLKGSKWSPVRLRQTEGRAMRPGICSSDDHGCGMGWAGSSLVRW